MLMSCIVIRRKFIPYIFKLQHKLEAPLVCAVPSDPIPTTLVACMPKIGISYANVYSNNYQMLEKTTVPVLISWEITSSIMMLVPMRGTESTVQLYTGKHC